MGHVHSPLPDTLPDTTSEDCLRPGYVKLLVDFSFPRLVHFDVQNEHDGAHVGHCVAYSFGTICGVLDRYMVNAGSLMFSAI